MRPEKLVIEITADKFSETLTDENGNVIWENISNMKSAGLCRQQEGCVDVFDCETLEDYDELQEEIDDMSFGPFGVAQALYKIKYEP